VKLHKTSLEFIILVPVAVFLLIAGVGSYYLILNSFEGYADRTIRQSLQSLSNGVYSIVDRSVDQLNRSGRTGNWKATRVQQVSALIDIEDFVRKNEIGVIIYDNGASGTLLVNGVPPDAVRAVPKGDSNRYERVSLSTGTYYANRFGFEPWDWQFVLLKHGAAFDALLLRTRYFYIGTAVTLLMIAIFLVVYLRRTIARPIHLIVDSFRAGDNPEYHGITEFEFLSDSIGKVMTEVRAHRDHLEEQVSERTADLLEEKTRTEEANKKYQQQNKILEAVSGQLAKYISPQLYKAVFSGEQKVQIESTRKKLTVFFSNVADFSEITDQLESEELTDLLNQYLTEMAKIAQQYGAVFDKSIGDSMMFYFGDPESRGVSEDAAACVRMAIAMQRRVRELQVRWREQGLIDRPFEARIGINTGYCTVGNFGSADRMDYTIIGGKVNLAARLEANADAGGILLASETYSLVSDWLAAEEQEPVTVKGSTSPIKTYSVTGIYEDLATEGRSNNRKVAGLSLDINFDRLKQMGKEEAIQKLKGALAQLEE
jgi:class 3 adenylate cyclase